MNKAVVTQTKQNNNKAEDATNQRRSTIRMASKVLALQQDDDMFIVEAKKPRRTSNYVNLKDGMNGDILEVVLDNNEAGTTYLKTVGKKSSTEANSATSSEVSIKIEDDCEVLELEEWEPNSCNQELYNICTMRSADTSPVDTISWMGCHQGADENADEKSTTGSEGRKKSRPKQKSYRKKVESVWPHESIIKLIEEVEVRRCLWDAGCPEYKLPKDHIWQEVADAVQVSFNDCKGKWGNLRTTFNWNLGKCKRKMSDQGADEEIRIVWRYFKPMMFLETTKVRQTTQSVSSMQAQSATPDEWIICDMGYADELKSTAPCKSRQQVSSKADPPTSSKPLNSGSKADLKEMAVKALQSLRSSDSQRKDTSTVFGEYIAAELRNLPSELASFARAKLRRAFNDILDEVALMQQQ